MLAGHGIICWADTAKECYEQTVQLIADAVGHLNGRLANGPAFGGEAVKPRENRAQVAAQLAQLGQEYEARGVGIVAINSNDTSKHPDDSPEQIDSWNRTWNFFEWVLRPYEDRSRLIPPPATGPAPARATQ